MGRQIRQEAIWLMIIAHPGPCAGWDFAGSFELRNGRRNISCWTHSRPRRETRPCAIEREPAGRLHGQMVSE